MMPYYLYLFVILAIGNSNSALNSCISSYCSSRRSCITPRSLAILSVGRERRVTSPSHTSSQQQQLIDKEEAARIKRTGQAKHRLEQSVRRENRISILESIDVLSSSEKAELDGLLKVRDNFEEQYSTASFTSEHVEFKRLHNEAFVALARYCHQDRYERGYIDDATIEKLKVFYLDGPDCGSTNILIDSAGFDPSQCYVANRHESTCKILKDVLPEDNVICATASESLSPSNEVDKLSFSDIDFCSYYFDGCGGYVPHIIQMISSALIRLDHDNQPRTIAVGFSLMGGNKDIVEKELEVNRALTVIANTRGMHTRHVLDDPIRYGIPNEICKTEGGTFTSWMLLEAEESR